MRVQLTVDNLGDDYIVAAAVVRIVSTHKTLEEARAALPAAQAKLPKILQAPGIIAPGKRAISYQENA